MTERTDPPGRVSSDAERCDDASLIESETLRDHPVPHAEFAGGRASVGRPRTARSLWILGAVLLACALAVAPAPARAASVLSNGTVSPGSGTTATNFDFSVHYSSLPSERAEEVWAQVGSVTIDLVRVSGSANNGTWAGSSLLPVGIWQVSFHATGQDGSQPPPFTVPDNVTVTLAPTPTPAPTPPPTPRPTPRPTAAPTPASPPGATPTPGAPPPGSTPRPSAPGPQPTSPPGNDDDPTTAPSSSTSANGTGDVLSGTPGGDPTLAPDEDSAPVESPQASDPANEDEATPRGSMLAPLLFVGGTMSLVGAAVLGRQWYVTRRRTDL